MSYEIAISVSLAIIAYIFAYLSTSLDDRHGPLQFLFMIISLMSIYIEFFILEVIATNNAQTNIGNVMQGGFSMMSYIILFVMGYFIILFLWEVLKLTSSAWRGKRGKE